MKIKGGYKNEIATELLSDLALRQKSGKTISKSEVKEALAEIKAELQDEFSHSSRGLARAERAIGNTLKLALESGWVKGESAASMIEDFLTEGTDGGLDELVADIRKDNSRRPSRTSYSGYSTHTTPTVRRTYNIGT
jgi:hypothetical protein